ncbi:MAG: polynucleotide adenylyltransferase PcnB [Leptospiraceae bacterium]|nr:polynucleotide adenylyltransferase PcnB [Leptospiraceae bacterium]MCP5497733.1 polynucleotide adenylyltransferase PcnB [Leptospiraceae bacterium]
MLQLLKNFFKKKPFSLENYLLYPDGNRYYRESHSVKKHLIDEDALKIIHRLNKFGYKAYVVGGGVRDILLGRKPKDFDVVTNATPNQVKNVFNNCRIIGRRFKLVHVIFKGKVIEVSTFRSLPDHRIKISHGVETDYLLKRDNNYGTAKEDAARRDFTINALYYDPRNESIVDYVGGYEDIKNKILRVIGDPDISFKEDPVRMLRAVKFSIIHGLTIEKKTRTAIKKNRLELEKASSSRMLEEYNKIFRTWKSSIIFQGLAENFLFEVLFKEVAEYLKKKNNKWQMDFLNTKVGNRLQIADRMLSEREELTPLIFYALIFSDLVDEALKNEAHPSIHTIREALENISNRIELSKRDKDRLIKIFASQNRFKNPEDKNKNQSDLFKRKEYFYESFMFFKIKALTENNEDAIQSAFFWEISNRVRPRYINRFKKEGDALEKINSQNIKRSTKKIKKSPDVTNIQNSKRENTEKNKHVSNQNKELNEKNKKLKDAYSNFLTYNPAEDSLVKFSGDLSNIQNKVLKIDGELSKVLRDDPSNILRIIRFSTVHNLKIDHEIKNAVQTYATEIQKIPFLKISEEFKKVFKSCKAAQIFQALAQHSILPFCFSEITEYLEKKDKNWYNKFLELEIGKKLSIADAIQLENGNLSPIIFYAILYGDLVTNIQSKNSKVTIQTLREKIEPICEELELAKKERDKLIKIFASQIKFKKYEVERNPKNKQLLLKNRDYFEPFVYFKINALVANNKEEIELASYLESKLDYKATPKKIVSKKTTTHRNQFSKKRARINNPPLPATKGEEP